MSDPSLVYEAVAVDAVYRLSMERNMVARTCRDRHSPGKLCAVGCRAGRGAEVRLSRQLRRHGCARVPGAGVGDAGHISDAVGSRADEADPQLQSMGLRGQVWVR